MAGGRWQAWRGGCSGEVLCGGGLVLFTRVRGRRRDGDQGLVSVFGPGEAGWKSMEITRTASSQRCLEMEKVSDHKRE